MPNEDSLWEVGFILEEMPLPEDKITVGNFSFESLSSNESEGLSLPALAKVKVQRKSKEKDLSKEREKVIESAERLLKDFVGLYALRIGYPIRIVRFHHVMDLSKDSLGNAISRTREREKLLKSIKGLITLALPMEIREQKIIRRALKETLKLTSQDLQSIDLSSKPNQYLRTALDYLQYSKVASQKEEKLIDLVIALEVIFSEGSHELSYRMAHRAASLLGESDQQKAELFKVVREIYNERSKIVHTGSSAYASDETLKHISRASIIVEESLEKFLILARKYSRRAILERLDIAIFDETKRDKLQNELRAREKTIEKKLKQILKHETN